MIFDLPDLVLDIIQDFLTPRNEFNVLEMLNTMNSEKELELFELCKKKDIDETWRNLMNTTKRVRELKRKTVHILLKGISALYYMIDEVFRQRVDGLLHNPRNQLHISFSEDGRKAFKLRNASFDGCYKLRLQNVLFSDFPGLSHIRILQLHRCKTYEKILHVNNIETLVLSGCHTIEAIGDCSRLTQLFVRSSSLRDISNLTNLTTLYVRHCPSLVIPEKTLQSVQFLWLGDNERIFPSHNINCLKRLKHLNIMDKYVVEDDIWQVDNLLSLSFTYCNNINVTRFPKNIHTLKFWCMTNFLPIDLSQMTNLSRLEFFKIGMFQQVINVPHTLRSLCFRNCLNLTDIYLNSPVNELIIDDSNEEDIKNNINNNSSVRHSYQRITLWIGPGVPIPKLTLTVYAKFSLKIIR